MSLQTRSQQQRCGWMVYRKRKREGLRFHRHYDESREKTESLASFLIAFYGGRLLPYLEEYPELKNQGLQKNRTPFFNRVRRLRIIPDILLLIKGAFNSFRYDDPHEPDRSERQDTETVVCEIIRESHFFDFHDAHLLPGASSL